MILLGELSTLYRIENISAPFATYVTIYVGMSSGEIRIIKGRPGLTKGEMKKSSSAYGRSRAPKPLLITIRSILGGGFLNDIYIEEVVVHTHVILQLCKNKTKKKIVHSST